MKFTRTIMPLLFGLAVAAPTASFAEMDEKTREELDLLKDEIVVLQDQLEEINLGNANRMAISGYTDVEYKVTSQDGAEDGFRIHHMSLFFDKRLSEQWKFFAEVEYEDGPFLEFKRDNTDSTCPKCAGKIFLEAVNFTYGWTPQVNLRAGRFFTPAGIWSIDHYPPFVSTQVRPEHIRKIFPQVVDGGTAFGTLSIGNAFLNYDAYVGNGEGNSGKEDKNSEKAVGLKLSLILPALFKYFEIGSTIYSDTHNDETELSANGVHLKMRIGNFTLLSEYAIGDYKPAAGEDYERTGYYAQFSFDTNKWTYGLRHDFYDETDANDTERTANTAFFNYHVSESIVLKVEHHAIEISGTNSSDYDETIASVVIYLGN